MHSIALSALLIVAVSGAAAGEAPAVAVGPAAYQQPLPGLSASALAAFREGAGIFRQAWVVGVSADTPRFSGLGPLFNRRSCIACHTGGGRGETSQGPDDPMRATLVRLGVAGAGEHGGPRAEPTYGDQLQTDSVLGVPGEGRAALRWRERTIRVKDGTDVQLRRPELVITDLGYGPFAKDTQFSVRTAPAVFGLGLLEGVSDEEIEARAMAPKPKGVRGHVNRVWDVERQALVVGRFGLKANQPTIKQQVAAALNGDMGITSIMFPRQDCTGAQAACADAPAGPQPEISDADLAALVANVAGRTPPPRRKPDAAIAAGERLFDRIGCAACHAADLTTSYPAKHTIHPYTDLLLHDMGEGLADNRPDYSASGREWRTAPLWGIGLASVVAAAPTYLHDGRARNLTEAVLWHGGEAQAARDGFAALPAAGRTELVAFLNSL